MPESAANVIFTLEDLIVAVGQKQDRAAFARLFTHFAPRVKAYLISAGSDSGAADELTQEVMLQVWRKAARFDPSQANAATWIFTIARNKRVDAFRSAKRAEFDPDDPTLAPDVENSASANLDLAEQAQLLGDAIRALPSEQSALLHEAFFEGKSHSVIAAESGLPLGTVKSRLRLALTRLRSRLDEQ